MLDKSKHRLHLIRILNYIYKNTKLASILGFKGGTAGYLFYGLPRFSTDLDFDLIDDSVDISSVINLLNNYLSSEYEILDQHNKRFTILWELSYEKHLNNIKIEISKRNNKFYNYNGVNFYGNTVTVVSVEHLIIQKMIALKERKVLANKDIYDVNYFLKSKYISQVDFNHLKVVTGMNAGDYLEELKEYLIKNKPRNILNGLGEVVDTGQKKWIKDNLFDETLQLLQMVIDSL